MTDNDGRDDEKEQVVNIENDFVPVSEGAGDELCEDVLHDENEPDDPVGTGERVVLGAGRAGAEQNPRGDSDHAEDHQRADDAHEDAVPIINSQDFLYLNLECERLAEFDLIIHDQQIQDSGVVLWVKIQILPVLFDPNSRLSYDHPRNLPFLHSF